MTCLENIVVDFTVCSSRRENSSWCRWENKWSNSNEILSCIVLQL